jgi:hypothetical protein
MASEFDGLVEEVSEFLRTATFVDDIDVKRIRRVLRLLLLPDHALRDAMRHQMDIVADLAWLNSKYGYALHQAETDLAKLRGKLAVEYRTMLGKVTDYVLRTNIEGNYDYVAAQDTVNQKRRLHEFLDTLKWALKDRSSIAINLFKEEMAN